MGEKTEKLRLVTVIDGAAESAEKLAKLAKRQRDVKKQAEDLVATARATIKERQQEIESIGETTDAQAGFVGQLKLVAEVAVQVTTALAGIVRGAEDANKRLSRIARTQREVKEQAKDLGRTIKETVKGRGEEAKSIDKVTEAQGRLKKQTDQSKWRVTERHVEMTDSLTKLAAILAIVTVGAIRFRRILGGLHRWVGNVAMGFASLTKALTSTYRVMRGVSAIYAFVAAIRSIAEALREEIAERMRLIEVMKIQSRVADELKNKQLEQQDTLERMANQRRQGGFAGPDVARRVSAGAVKAGKVFTQLTEQDVNLAFGTFGDVEGLSQRQREDLAVVASFGGFGELGRVEGLPPKKQAEWLLERNRERIATFARTETLQGQGMGRAEFRAGGPTERTQRAIAEGRAVSGAKGTFRERLRELLPPDWAARLAGEEESRLERAVRHYELFGTAGEFEAAKVGYAGLRPLTTAMNRLRGRVEIALPDQPGFVNQAQNAVGFTEVFDEMRIGAFAMELQAFRRMEREGLPAGGGAGVTIHNYNQHSKHLYPDARSQQGVIRNGQSRKYRQAM